MKELITYIVSSIVDHPEKLEISHEINETTGFTTYILSVDPQDMGRVIGKKGKIIKSLRNLIHAAAVKRGQKIVFALKEEKTDLPSH